MSGELHQVFARAKDGDPGSFRDLVKAFRGDLRLFIATYVPSLPTLDVAEREVWKQIHEQLPRCPADPTVSAWARHIAATVLTRLLHGGDSRAIAKQDTIGHLLIQEGLQGLQAGSIDNAVALRVEARFAVLDEATRKLLASRTAGTSLGELARDSRSDESRVAGNLFAARAGLAETGAAAPPPLAAGLPLLIESYLDGSQTPEQQADFRTQLGRNLELSIVFARQARVHLLLKVLLAWRNDAATDALASELAKTFAARSRTGDDDGTRAESAYSSAPAQRQYRTPAKIRSAGAESRRTTPKSNALIPLVTAMGALLVACVGWYLIWGRASPPPRPDISAPGNGAKPTVSSELNQGSATASPPISNPKLAAPEPSHPTPSIRPIDPGPAPIVIDDFERSEIQMAGDGENKVAALLSLVHAPPGGGHGMALSMAWPTPHGRFIDCHYTKRRPAEFTAATFGAVKLALWVKPNPGPRTLGIHFMDVEKEDFQWHVQIPNPAQAGWCELVIPLPLDNPAGHWGPPTANGRVDFPVFLNAYSLDYDAKLPAETILIDDVLMLPPKKP